MAACLITQGYEILARDVGAPNPSDNAFLREAMICAELGLIWQEDRAGIDAIDLSTGEEVEIKSSKFTPNRAVTFPTSRGISPTVIKRFRASGYWLFGIFDNFGNLAIVYRVDGDGMAAKIDQLEATMHSRAAAQKVLSNNPHTPLNSIRPFSGIVFQSPDFEERELRPGCWSIRPK